MTIRYQRISRIREKSGEYGNGIRVPGILFQEMRPVDQDRFGRTTHAKKQRPEIGTRWSASCTLYYSPAVNFPDKFLGKRAEVDGEGGKPKIEPAIVLSP